MNMNDKSIIKKITSYHPASDAGINRGWSYYVGGMKDTGEWYYAKLLSATSAELRACLNELKEEWKPKPPKIYTEEEKRQMNTVINLPNNSGFITEYMHNQMQKLNLEIENALFYRIS